MKKVIMAACIAISLTTFAGLALADKDHESIPKTAVSLEQATKAITDKYPKLPYGSDRRTGRRWWKWTIQALASRQNICPICLNDSTGGTLRATGSRAERASDSRL